MTFRLVNLILFLCISLVAQSQKIDLTAYTKLPEGAVALASVSTFQGLKTLVDIPINISPGFPNASTPFENI